MNEKCFVCVQHGHTIDTCTDPIIEFGYQHVIRIYNSTHTREEFASMISFDRGAKAASIKYTNTSRKRTREEHINALYDHCATIYGAQPPELNEEDDDEPPSVYGLSFTIDESEFEDIEDTFECSICMEITNKNNSVLLQCQHIFCASCIKNQIKVSKSRCCAFCRTDFEHAVIPNLKVRRQLGILLIN